MTLLEMEQLATLMAEGDEIVVDGDAQEVRIYDRHGQLVERYPWS